MKKESSLKKKINELKKTEKGKAILKLIRWGIFFFVLFAFLIIASFFSSKTSNNNPVSEKKEVIDNVYINKLLDTLSHDEYQYDIEIKKAEEVISFQGTKTSKINEGYKETSDGIIKYYIDDTGIYQKTSNENIPILNLYESLNEEYLIQDNLIKNLKSLNFIRNDNCGEACAIMESNDNNIIYTINLKKGIVSDDNLIEEIKIEGNDVSYTFKYSYFRSES